MIKVVVDRTKWNRGNVINSALLNEHGMCCLGFACLALGFTEDEINELKTPSSLREYTLMRKPGDNDAIAALHPLLDERMNYNGEVALKLMSVNDRPWEEFNGIKENAEVKREERIKELGLQVELEFEFIN